MRSEQLLYQSHTIYILMAKAKGFRLCEADKSIDDETIKNYFKEHVVEESDV